MMAKTSAKNLFAFWFSCSCHHCGALSSLHLRSITIRNSSWYEKILHEKPTTWGKMSGKINIPGTRTVAPIYIGWISDTFQPDVYNIKYPNIDVLWGTRNHNFCFLFLNLNTVLKRIQIQRDLFKSFHQFNWTRRSNSSEVWKICDR